MATGLYRAALVVALAAWLATGCGPRTGDPETVRVSESRRLMGAPWTITVHAASRAAGSAAIAAAFAEIERLERVLSDYDPESELSRLSAAAPTDEPVAVGADLWRVLVTAEAVREKTAGAFDIAVGPLTSLWRQARKSGRLPRPDKLAAARAAVGAGTVELVPEARSVRLPKAGSRLDPGGIGMGYAADRALEVLTARGIGSAMIDASGDVLVSAAPPGTTGWRIAVRPLRPGGTGEMLTLSRAAVTSSGDAYQAVEIEGVRYSHIVDPRTGLGVTGQTAVTVIAPDATTADALATAASVLGHVAEPAVIATFPGCSARFVWREEDADRVLTTSDWPGHPHEP
jgi:thiamine biosynthesis lipoprotein